MTSHAPLCDADMTEPVLSAVLAEALALTEEIALADEARRALTAPDRWDSAARLALAARLARIAAWACAAGTQENDRREAASAALNGAVAAPRLDLAAGDSPEDSAALLALAARVDRLATRALRLDALLSGFDEAPASRPAPERAAGPRAAILPFPTQARLDRASGQA